MSQLERRLAMSATIEAAAGGPFRSLDLPDAEVLFYQDFFPAADADRLLRELLETTAWRQDFLRMGRNMIPFRSQRRRRRGGRSPVKEPGAQSGVC
jgi:hypothetical protein